MTDGLKNWNDLLGIFLFVDIMSTQGDIHFTVKIKCIASVLQVITQSLKGRLKAHSKLEQQLSLTSSNPWVKVCPVLVQSGLCGLSWCADAKSRLFP
jgi:hypothetical protein